MFATIIATYETFRISQHHFPNIHGKHNKANAFRHALWNILIAKKASFFSADERVLKWTKEITDWHEEFSPNSDMAKLMDLHNNAIGRNFYLEIGKKSISEITQAMLKKTESAYIINSQSEIIDMENMVYLN